MYGFIDYWNENSKNITVRQLADKFSLSYNKTLYLLKEYSEQGLCKYCADVEILKDIERKSNKVYSYDCDTGNLKTVYNSMKEACKKLGITTTKLNTILNRKNNKDGIILKLYKTNNIYDYIQDYEYKGVERIDKDGNVVFYESLNDVVTKNLDFNTKIVRNCCSSGKPYNNFLWRYKYYSKLKNKQKEEDNNGNIF